MGHAMKYDIESPECSPVADSSAIKVAIIYEDFASGLRAKNFAERLAEQLGCACRLADSFWRSDLLECPPIAAEAARVAADCDYLIVSLRGDRVLPLTARRWIEMQLDGAAGGGAALVVLPDADQGKWQVVEATRDHFRTVCARKGVAFYSHATGQPADRARTSAGHHEEATEAGRSEQRWTPDWSLSESLSDPRHELVRQR